MDTKKTKKENGYSNCFPKRQLRSGYRSPDFIGDLYLRLLKSNNISYDNPVEEFSLDCSSEGTIQLDRTYVKSSENRTVALMLWFAGGVAVLEIVCILTVWCLLIRT